jgi:hypothetical protein
MYIVGYRYSVLFSLKRLIATRLQFVRETILLGEHLENSGENLLAISCYITEIRVHSFGHISSNKHERIPEIHWNQRP